MVLTTSGSHQHKPPFHGLVPNLSHHSKEQWVKPRQTAVFLWLPAPSANPIREPSRCCPSLGPRTVLLLTLSSRDSRRRSWCQTESWLATIKTKQQKVHLFFSLFNYGGATTVEMRSSDDSISDCVWTILVVCLSVWLWLAIDSRTMPLQCTTCRCNWVYVVKGERMEEWMSDERGRVPMKRWVKGESSFNNTRLLRLKKWQNFVGKPRKKQIRSLNFKATFKLFVFLSAYFISKTDYRWLKRSENIV